MSYKSNRNLRISEDNTKFRSPYDPFDLYDPYDLYDYLEIVNSESAKI